MRLDADAGRENFFRRAGAAIGYGMTRRDHILCIAPMMDW